MVTDKDFEERTKKKLESKFQLLKTAKIIGEIVGFALFLFFLYVVLPDTSFVTNDYSTWTPIALWTTTLGTFLKIIKHAIDIDFLKRTLDIGSLILSAYSTYMLLVIYPLDFSRVGLSQLNQIFPFALNLAILAICIGIFVNIFKILFSVRK
jgi:hypothetical protein